MQNIGYRIVVIYRMTGQGSKGMHDFKYTQETESR